MESVYFLSWLYPSISRYSSISRSSYLPAWGVVHESLHGPYETRSSGGRSKGAKLTVLPYFAFGSFADRCVAGVLATGRFSRAWYSHDVIGPFEALIQCYVFVTEWLHLGDERLGCHFCGGHKWCIVIKVSLALNMLEWPRSAGEDKGIVWNGCWQIRKSCSSSHHQ